MARKGSKKPVILSVGDEPPAISRHDARTRLAAAVSDLPGMMYAQISDVPYVLRVVLALGAAQITVCALVEQATVAGRGTIACRSDFASYSRNLVDTVLFQQLLALATPILAAMTREANLIGEIDLDS